MSELKKIIEPAPKCISCEKEIEECCWIYYGGDMRETNPEKTIEITMQIYWCHDCFQEKIAPKLAKET